MADTRKVASGGTNVRKRTSIAELLGYEAIVVLALVAALVAFALPAYGSVIGKAQETSGRADVSAAASAAERYALQHGGYGGLSGAALPRSVRARVVVLGVATPTSYCLRDADPALPNYYKHGPSGTITRVPCSSA